MRIKEKNYNYIKCNLKCSFKGSSWGNSCYDCVKEGTITDCDKWWSIDLFRLFIAIEREKRNEL